MVKNGQPHDLDYDRASRLLRKENITIRVDVGTGNAEHTMWTCDLSPGYVAVDLDRR